MEIPTVQQMSALTSRDVFFSEPIHRDAVLADMERIRGKFDSEYNAPVALPLTPSQIALFQDPEQRIDGSILEVVARHFAGSNIPESLKIRSQGAVDQRNAHVRDKITIIHSLSRMATAKLFSAGERLSLEQILEERNLQLQLPRIVGERIAGAMEISLINGAILQTAGMLKIDPRFMTSVFDEWDQYGDMPRENTDVGRAAKKIADFIDDHSEEVFNHLYDLLCGNA